MNYICLMLSEMDNYYFFKNRNMSRSLYSLFIFEHAKGNEYPLFYTTRKRLFTIDLVFLMLKIICVFNLHYHQHTMQHNAHVSLYFCADIQKLFIENYGFSCVNYTFLL